MQQNLLKFTLLASSLLLSVDAWPLIPLLAHQQQKRAPASYSVVAVDGGSTADSAPTATVTNLITRTQLLTTTQVATSVLTESDEPTTIFLTNTITIPTTIVETPAAVVSTAVVTQTPSAAPSASNPQTLVTVTVTGKLQPVTKPYDDGEWHTTYYYTVSSAESTSSPAAAASTPVVNDGKWQPQPGWNATWAQ